MFKKLVSNLPFSPSLVAQLGFYARRLKKEQWMRRLGLIFTVFALVIQSFAMFSPPESANAASANDMVPGGIGSVSRALQLWDNNSYNFKDIMSHFGITRNELASCRVDNSWTQKYANWPYSFGRTWQGFAGEQAWNIPKTGGGTVYMTSEPLWSWGGGNNWFIGLSCNSSRAGEFYIMKNCGNLSLKKLPPPPTTPTAGCQILDITVNSGPAEGIAGQTEYKIGPYGWRKDGGTISDYYIEWSGPDKGTTGWISMTDWWYHKFSKPGTYKITAYVRGSSGTVTSAACTKNLTVKEAPDPKYDLAKTVDSKTVKPGGTLNYTLTFKNLGNVALTNVIIKDALPGSVTLSGKPVITPAIASSGDLFSNAGLKLNSVAAGQTITIKYSTKVDPFEKLTCGQNKIVNQASVKTDQKKDDGNKDETNPNNNSQTTSVEAICEFEYDLEKVGDKETARPGETVKYNLTFRNTGNRELTNIVIKDTLPSGMTLDGKITSNPANSISGNLFDNNGLKIAKVAAKQNVVISYTVKIADKTDFQCGASELVNKASAITKESNSETNQENNDWVTEIERICNCSDPEIAKDNPECQDKKTAVNNTQGGVDATTVRANGGDVITFTIAVTNTSGTDEIISIDDALKDTLEYADLTDQGGGVFDEETQTLSWQVELKSGETAVRNFSVTVKNPVPSQAQGESYPMSYDCKMTNSLGTTIDIPVNCPPEKIIEQVITQLPVTGPGENIIFGVVVIAIVVFFYARSRQLGKEVRLVRREFNTGTL